ncbi:hypothetical protein PHMEG_00041522 [Phytophthora megakarya]|uniref:Uncharacterized protein n=1 Tax=Phytophthora megakarya TaxID=4795 RepID=A0A225UBH5_9STRA|nr:hypothetical protein PHMEG_00041522 [Phytophthora megakarya]
MSPGVIDVLTVIPIEEIRPKGILFVVSKLSTKGAVRLWSDFWTYFTRTWLKLYPPETWNVNAYVASETDMQNRTNKRLHVLIRSR